MTTPPSTESPRAISAKVLEDWLETGSLPERFLESRETRRAVITEIVLGVVRWKRYLDWVLQRYVPLKPHLGTHSYLLVGVYQLLKMDNIEEFAVVHDTVEWTKRTQSQSAANLVNAVLRNVLREKADIKLELRDQPMGVVHSHPDDLLERWFRAHGSRSTQVLCEWNNTIPELIIRANTLQTTFGKLRAALKENDIPAEPHPFAPTECLTLPTGHPVRGLPGYDDGWFSVQDPSTLASIRLLDPQPGDRVLDACAAPGGKTALIAQRMNNDGHILAIDYNEGRLERVHENMDRLRVTCVATAVADARYELSTVVLPADEQFDRILVDVPCSNTGVLRRRTDARWKFTPSRMHSITRHQVAILNSAAKRLKPGGTLVYSTCSIEQEECETLVLNWLRQNPAFKMKKATKLFPPRSQTDGIYAAAMTRETVAPDS